MVFESPYFLVPAGTIAGVIFGLIGGVKFLKNGNENGNVKKSECEGYRRDTSDALNQINGRLSNIEGYLEGIHGKKIKRK